MIISRKPLSESELEIAKAHLLLNDKYIRISEDEFCAMLKSQSTPLKFREKFNRFCNPFDDPILSEYSTKIAIIPESWIKSLPGYTEEEQRTIIDLMRLHSLAPKYNKINQKASENDIYEHTDCDKLLVLMSGNFTQRGENAVENKFVRAEYSVTETVNSVTAKVKKTVGFGIRHFG